MSTQTSITLTPEKEAQLLALRDKDVKRKRPYTFLAAVATTGCQANVARP